MITIVETAWRNALRLDAGAPELAISWEAAGGDSLAMLQLLLELEERLGRRIDYALIEPDMGIVEIAAVLEIDRGAVTMANIIFLLPGQFGDGPGLARFRNRLESRWQTLVVDLPSLDADGSVLGNMAASGRFAADIIEKAQPEGAIRLAGHSFGGSVALEAAHELERRGRDVAFLGIFDSAFGAAALGRPAVSDFRNGWFRLAHRTVLRLLMPLPVRRVVLAAATRLPAARRITAHNFIAQHFRKNARSHWQPVHITCRVFIAVSAEFERQTLPIWQALLPQARIVHLPGRHNAILEGDALALLVTAFEAALSDTMRNTLAGPVLYPDTLSLLSC
jgi:thioesterase domain-containing protein